MLALCKQMARKLRHIHAPDIPSLQLLVQSLKTISIKVDKKVQSAIIQVTVNIII